MNKVCRECGLTYPATNAYFRRSRKTSDGLQSICKRCLNRHSYMKRWPEYIATYRYIECFLQHNGVSPSLRQIAEHIGISLTATYSRVNNLVRFGFLQREGYGKSRTLQLTDKQFVWWISQP